ncbi:MAG: family 16 glycosylhydrolase [Melioribacteraceae bacterium]|nr:family 16 glycosylhydrolase [Melioribacteraceae bacterium]MCF8264590.1 family 16 glycosylhydrolase [Melioribacteraceae bacterium]
MKIKLILFVLIAISRTLVAQDWQLVWSDEFDGNSINADNWTHEIGGSGWGNEELQHYTDRSTNSYVENGKLYIVAQKENYNGNQYTSARLITKGKKSFKYGKIEALIKVPYGKGIWPAFWTLGTNISSVGWPKCGEIDILEMIGGGTNDNTAHANLHWDNNGHASYGGSKVMSTKLHYVNHKYSIIWDESEIRWYLNDVLYHSADIKPEHTSEFHEPHFIILNVAVGGVWPGSPDATTEFPQQMEVDWVRVYSDVSKLPSVSLQDAGTPKLVDAFGTASFTADASDPDGTIRKVELFHESANLGKFEGSGPYTFNWEDLYPGCYNVFARVTDSDGNSVDSEPIEVKVGNSCGQAPYFGTAWFGLDTIQAENYDIGGNGVSYFDQDDNTNIGEVYRKSEGVDIEANLGGYNIGWIDDGEWLEYTIEIKDRGNYSFLGTVAALNSGSSFTVSIDGGSNTDPIDIAATNSWTTYRTVFASGLFLMEGYHVIRVTAVKGNFNFDYFRLKLDFATGVENVGEINEIRLRQNYPNPFNPKTTISYEIPADLNSPANNKSVSLKVYDMLGNVVATLVDEEKSQGIYQVDFDASSISSGIYYYTLRVGEFAESKKMILLK